MNLAAPGQMFCSQACQLQYAQLAVQQQQQMSLRGNGAHVSALPLDPPLPARPSASFEAQTAALLPPPAQLAPLREVSPALPDWDDAGSPLRPVHDRNQNGPQDMFEHRDLLQMASPLVPGQSRPPAPVHSETALRAIESEPQQVLEVRQQARAPRGRSAPRAPAPRLVQAPTRSPATARPTRAQRGQMMGEAMETHVLALVHSQNPADNLARAVRVRMMASNWRRLVWTVRMFLAHVDEGLPFRRNPRWQARLFAADVATMWGHLGSAVRTLRGDQGPMMFRGM